MASREGHWPTPRMLGLNVLKAGRDWGSAWAQRRGQECEEARPGKEGAGVGVGRLGATAQAMSWAWGHERCRMEGGLRDHAILSRQDKNP